MREKIFHKEPWTSKEVCQSEHVVNVHKDSLQPCNLDVPLIVANEVKRQLKTELNERRSHFHPKLRNFCHLQSHRCALAVRGYNSVPIQVLPNNGKVQM